MEGKKEKTRRTGLDLYGPSPPPIPPSFAAEPCASAASPSPYREAWRPLWASGTASSVTGAEALPMATSTCLFPPAAAAEQIAGRRASAALLLGGVGARCCCCCWELRALSDDDPSQAARLLARHATKAAGIGVGEMEKKKEERMWRARVSRRKFESSSR